MTNNNKARRALLASLCIVMALLFAPQNSHAAPVLDFTGGSAGGAHSTTNDVTVGWVFDVNSMVNIDALGVWDEGGDGFVHTHQVGLWTIGGTLLASATVTNGSTSITSTSADGVWLFEDISTVTLDVGRYAIAAVYDLNDDFIRTGTSISTIGEISYVEATTASSGLTFPNRFKGANGGFLGPNLRAEAAQAIPEPVTLAVLGFGLAGLGFVRRRRFPRQGLNA